MSVAEKQVEASYSDRLSLYKGGSIEFKKINENTNVCIVHIG